MTAVLIFGGAALIFLMEQGNPETMKGMSAGEKALSALFQSVTTKMCIRDRGWRRPLWQQAWPA